MPPEADALADALASTSASVSAKALAHARSFPRSQRLTRGSEIALVRQEGKRVRTAHLDVRAMASLHAFPRVGFVVPRYKQSAVARNRLKRRLRELVRLEWLPVLPALDVVMRVTPPAYTKDFSALRAELLVAGQRLQKLVVPPRTSPSVEQG